MKCYTLKTLNILGLLNNGHAWCLPPKSWDFSCTMIFSMFLNISSSITSSQLEFLIKRTNSILESSGSTTMTVVFIFRQLHHPGRFYTWCLHYIWWRFPIKFFKQTHNNMLSLKGFPPASGSFNMGNRGENSWRRNTIPQKKRHINMYNNINNLYLIYVIL